MSPVLPFTYGQVVDAPRKLAYLVNTDPAHLVQWFGPAGAKVIKASMDLRPGGTYHYGLRLPDGSEMWGKQSFREVVPNEKLVLIQTFSDPQGGLSRHPLSATWPRQMLATTTFEDTEDGKTRMTISWAPHEATTEELATFDGARPSMTGGFDGMMGNLERYLKTTETELMHSRWLAAPRERVWQALTDPAQVNAWWGPDGFRNEVASQDVRVGGSWTFTMVGPDGKRFPNHSVYQELTAPERLVYDLGDGRAVLATVLAQLEEEAAGTRIRWTLQARDRKKRDGFAGFAIEGGQQTLRKLEAFLARAA